MQPRALALALLAAWLSVPGDAAARPRASTAPALTLEQQLAPTTPAATAPVAVAKPTEPARPLHCRQYVAAARTTIAVACPEPGPTVQPPVAAPASTREAPKPATPAPSSTSEKRPSIEATACRRFLPSIGETIAVACDPKSDASETPSARAEATPPVASKPIIVADRASQ